MTPEEEALFETLMKKRIAENRTMGQTVTRVAEAQRKEQVKEIVSPDTNAGIEELMVQELVKAGHTPETIAGFTDDVKRRTVQRHSVIPKSSIVNTTILSAIPNMVDKMNETFMAEHEAGRLPVFDTDTYARNALVRDFVQSLCDSLYDSFSGSDGGRMKDLVTNVGSVVAGANRVREMEEENARSKLRKLADWVRGD